MSDEKRMDTALLAENDENTAAEENALVMKLDKPFTFEGQTYTEVDLSGLDHGGRPAGRGPFRDEEEPGGEPRNRGNDAGIRPVHGGPRRPHAAGVFRAPPRKGGNQAERHCRGFSLRRGWGQLTPAVINRACVGLSIQLRTGLDYLLALSVSDLNELADTVTQYAEEVAKHGRQK